MKITTKERKDASDFTQKVLRKISEDEKYMSHKTQEELAKEGFLFEGNPNTIINEKNGYNFDQYKEFIKEKAPCPCTVHPALWEHAKLNMNVGIFRVNNISSTPLKEDEKITPQKGDVFQIRGYDLANMTLVRGEKGWVILDVLTVKETAAHAFKEFTTRLAERESTEITGIIYSHSHVDHYGGVAGLITDISKLSKIPDDDGIKILAPEGFLKYAVSENIYAGNAMSTRAAFMYGSYLERDAQGQVDAGLGKATATGTNTLIAPTEEIGFKDIDEGCRYVQRIIDGITFHIQITPGTEAPAEMNVYMPDTNILFIAENCTGTLHNLYTLRGAEVRDGMAWADYLDETIVIFPKVETICSSHNWPHFGHDECIKYMELQRDAYRYITNTTLNLINQGYTLDEVGRTVEQSVPADIRNEWCNHGFYGTVNHNAKAVYQKYLGWYDGNPSNLNKILPVESATKYVECMGGMAQVLNFAQQAMGKGEYAWAAELLNKAIFATPKENEKSIQEQAKLLNADALEQLGYQSESAPWRNEYLTAAMMLRMNQNPVSGKGSANEASVNAMTIEMIMQFAGIMFNGKEAQNEKIEAFNVYFTDSKEKCALWAERGVLNYRKYDETTPNKEDLSCKKMEFYQWITKTEGKEYTGDKISFKKLLEYIEPFKLGFNIVTPRKSLTPQPQFIPQDIRKLILECAQMFEKYEYSMIQKGTDIGKTYIPLKEPDMYKWKNDYYRKLTVDKVFDYNGEKVPYLEDYLFFSEKGKEIEDRGIGKDGSFFKVEYAHFMYECYKKLALDARYFPYIINDCIQMLEKYVDAYRAHAPEDSAGTINELNTEDKEQWLKTYHPVLVQMNIILDDKFIDPSGQHPHYGIGNDGKFNLAELCNVLSRCYKLVLINEFANLIR